MGHEFCNCFGVMGKPNTQVAWWGIQIHPNIQYLGSMADKEVNAINDGFDMICLCQRSKSDIAEEGDVR